MLTLSVQQVDSAHFICLANQFDIHPAVWQFYLLLRADLDIATNISICLVRIQWEPVNLVENIKNL